MLFQSATIGYFQLLDIGDIIGAEGYLFITRTGELSLHVESLWPLSKTLLGMPEKWHGLEDVEIRYRQRYLDLIANPGVRDIFVTRAKVVSSIRRQLEERDFIEVETPMMQGIYGGAAARPFVTHHNTLDIDLYLRIAPGFISSGWWWVVLNACLRSTATSAMKESQPATIRNSRWSSSTRPTADYRVLMDLTETMLRQIAIDATGGTVVEYGSEKLDFGTIRRDSPCAKP